MTRQKTRLIGATAIAAIAIAGALIAWQASSQSPADPVQLSDKEKLEILNSGDADAITELLDAEEAAAKAQFARERLERQKREAEIQVERAEAEARGAAYWNSFDPDSIDLSGFDFAMAEVGLREERRAMLDKATFVTDFERASEVTYPRSKFDCNRSRFEAIDKLLAERRSEAMKVDASDVARISDYLNHRAALETGDCSCATQMVRPQEAFALIERLANHPSSESLKSAPAREKAMHATGILFLNALEDEKRQLCGRS